MESDERYEHRIDCEHYLPPYGGCALFSECGGVGDPALDIPCLEDAPCPWLIAYDNKHKKHKKHGRKNNKTKQQH